MSYFIDPWLYNCASNPADSPGSSSSSGRSSRPRSALDYAAARRHADCGGGQRVHRHRPPDIDVISPDFPPGAACFRRRQFLPDVPTEGNERDQRRRGRPEQDEGRLLELWLRSRLDVAAPGGYFRDLFGTPGYRTVATQILAPYPRASRSRTATSTRTGPDHRVRRPRLPRSTCAYCQYIQGTSMASPHAVGVAALIVNHFGQPDPPSGGLLPSAGISLPRRRRNRSSRSTATPHPCPTPPVLDYTNVGRPTRLHGNVYRHGRGEQHLGDGNRRRPQRCHRPLIALAGGLGASPRAHPRHGRGAPPHWSRDPGRPQADLSVRCWTRSTRRARLQLVDPERGGDARTGQGTGRRRVSGSRTCRSRRSGSTTS